MARTVFDYMQAVQKVIDNLPKETTRIAKEKEASIYKLNIIQISDGKDIFDKKLTNSNKKFSGRYTQLTEEISRLENPLLPKIAGSLYNFVWDGDFAKSFFIKFNTGAMSFTIENNGMDNTPSKTIFFNGYGDKLLGLSAKDQRKVNYEIIRPELINYIKKHL